MFCRATWYLDRTLKIRTYANASFFDLMINLRASIWSKFEVILAPFWGTPHRLRDQWGKMGNTWGRFETCCVTCQMIQITTKKNFVSIFLIVMKISARELEPKNAPKLLFWAVGEKLIWIASYDNSRSFMIFWKFRTFSRKILIDAWC